jgi:hypothetical protein
MMQTPARTCSYLRCVQFNRILFPWQALTMKTSLKIRIGALVEFLIAIAVALSVVGMAGMQQSNKGLKTVYEDRTVDSATAEPPLLRAQLLAA